MQFTPTRIVAIIAAAVVAVGAAIGAGVAFWPDDSDSADNPRTESTVAVTAPTTVEATVATAESVSPTTEQPSSGVTRSGPSTLVASFAADIPQFDEPDGSKVGMVPATWHERPSILPVVDQVSGWLQVRLPERPNGSTTWIRRDDVELAVTPYRVEIDVATTRLRLYQDGVEILEAPVGIGTDDAPTTVGNFFVTFVQEPPDTTSGWGPFVIVTSSHSETISDFESSGDAIAAIHGPLGASEEIGETGAKVSHGCIRMHLDDLDALSVLPAGTPIDVIDSRTIKGAKVLNFGGFARAA